MNVTSAQYITDPVTGATDKDIEAVIDGITYTVPVNTGNRHYQAILDWVAEGNSIADAD